MEIVKKLMLHMDKAEGSHYRDELLTKIIEICSQSNYQYITNFEWYVSGYVVVQHSGQHSGQCCSLLIVVQAHNRLDNLH